MKFLLFYFELFLLCIFLSKYFEIDSTISFVRQPNYIIEDTKTNELNWLMISIINLTPKYTALANLIPNEVWGLNYVRLGTVGLAQEKLKSWLGW